MEDLLQGFLDYCKFNRALVENTIRSYAYDVGEYLAWLKRIERTVETAKLVDLDDYLIFLAKSGNKNSTVNRKIYALRMFYRWLQRREIIRDNMTIHLRNLKQPQRLPHFLTLDQQEALLKEAKKSNSKPAWMRERDYLLMLFLIDTGLRVDEASRVRLQDLDLKEQVFQVIGKGDKQRLVVISDRLKLAIERYLKRIEKLKLGAIAEFAGFAARGLSSEDVAAEIGTSAKAVRIAMARQGEYTRRPRTITKIRAFWRKAQTTPQKLLFFNRMGEPLITRYIFRIVKDLGRKIGVRDLHPHMLRHTFATNLRRKNADLLLIKEALGHSSVSTTEMYAHIADEQYRKSMRELLR